VAVKKSIPGKTPKEAVSEKSGSGSGDGGLRGFLDGRFGADHPRGETMCSVGCIWVYIFNRRMVKKLIPVKWLSGSLSDTNTKTRKEKFRRRPREARKGHPCFRVYEVKSMN
jgi:hypothetical protein